MHFRLSTVNPANAMPTPVVYVSQQIGWDYQQLRLDHLRDAAACQAILDPLGAEGWELVTIVEIGGVGYAFLKRQRNR
ncbi:MAG: hypothetical protein GYB68_19515 [Chloroflexi bacterium]|nr:hypothetical protein [Chloroflexota bacterium]